MRVASVLAALCVLGACSTSTSFTETSSEVRFTSGLGGLVPHTGRQYNAILNRSDGKKFVIDGPMYSADAFYAFSIPGACYTRNAVFAPHAASYLSLVPDYQLTEKLTDMLPAELATWFRNDHSFYDWFGFSEVGYERLKEIWPEGACSNDAPSGSKTL